MPKVPPLPLPLSAVLILALGLGAGSLARQMFVEPPKTPVAARATVQFVGFEWAHGHVEATYRIAVMNFAAEPILIGSIRRGSVLPSLTDRATALPLSVPAGELGLVDVSRSLSDCPTGRASKDAIQAPDFLLQLGAGATTAQVKATPLGVLHDRSDCQLADLRLPGGWRNPVSGRIVARGRDAGNGLDIEVPISTVNARSVEGNIEELVRGTGTFSMRSSNSVLLALRPEAGQRCGGSVARNTPLPTGFTLVVHTASAAYTRYVVVGPELARWANAPGSECH